MEYKKEERKYEIKKQWVSEIGQPVKPGVQQPLDPPAGITIIQWNKHSLKALMNIYTWM